MPSTDYLLGSSNAQPDEDGDYVITRIVTKTGQETYHYGAGNSGPYRRLNISLSDGSLINDSTDTETVTISVRDGLEIARGSDPTDATILDYNGDVTVRIDGAEVTKTLTSGSVEFGLTTGKTAGSTIEIVAESLADAPAESDSATVEVIQA